MFYLNKKQNIKRIKTLISSLLIAGVLIVVGVRPGVIGQTADDLVQKKAEKQKQLEVIEKKIAQYQTEIKANQKQANTLANQIKTINLEIAETQAQIEATNNKIDAANLEIADVTNKIVIAQRDIAKQKEILKSLIADINDLDQRSPLEIALENDNFQQFIDQLQYDLSIQQQSQDVIGGNEFSPLIQDAEALGIPVKVATDPLTAVVRGTGIVLEDFESYREALLTSDHELVPTQ